MIKKRSAFYETMIKYNASLPEQLRTAFLTYTQSDHLIVYASFNNPHPNASSFQYVGQSLV